jgi:hypothetical protein
MKINYKSQKPGPIHKLKTKRSLNSDHTIDTIKKPRKHAYKIINTINTIHGEHFES